LGPERQRFRSAGAQGGQRDQQGSQDRSHVFGVGGSVTHSPIAVMENLRKFMGSSLFLLDLLTGQEPHVAGNHWPPKAVPISIASSLRPPRLCASLGPPSKAETGVRAEPQRARRKNAAEPRMDMVCKPAGGCPRIAPLLGVFKGPLLKTATPSGTRGAKATAIARMRWRFRGSRIFRFDLLTGLEPHDWSAEHRLGSLDVGR